MELPALTFDPRKVENRHPDLPKPASLLKPIQKPPSFLAHDTGRSNSRKNRPSSQDSRDLGSNDNYQSVLVDKNGNGYDPYSLGWRYLGVYMDCDLESMYADDDDGGSGDRRRKLSGSGDGNDCSRKVLWAAYLNKHYRGNEIGGYQFFDWINERWDRSTCEGGRCAKMDCHTTRSQFKLLGIYKEDGIYDFHEQLFKHSGVCLWNSFKGEDDDDDDGSGSGDDNDLYESMSSMMEKWPTECTKMYLGDGNGNDVYLNTQPLPGGNLTYGMYYDEGCSQVSDFAFSDYLIRYYTYYYGNSDKGYEESAAWQSIFDKWNTGMEAFKMCHPCRAFSTYKNSNDDDASQSKDDRRHLNTYYYEEQNDGDGDEEKHGYNCYDEAGYLNCNQCYKFETHTDMEQADHYDLAIASAQGTILAIQYEGVWYGSGKYYGTGSNVINGLFAGAGVLLLLGICFLLRHRIKKLWNQLRAHQQNLELPRSLKEMILVSPGSEDSYERAKRTAREQAEKMANIQKELDEERAMRYLEQNRSSRYIKKLEHQITTNEVLPSPSFLAEYDAPKPIQEEDPNPKTSADIDISAIVSLSSMASIDSGNVTNNEEQDLDPKDPAGVAMSATTYLSTMDSGRNKKKTDGESPDPPST